MNVIGELTNQIEWNRYLNCWKDIVNFEGVLYPSREEYLKAIESMSNERAAEEHSACAEATDEPVENASLNDRSKNDAILNNIGVLRYRVTCNRSGKHTFGSQDAARSFGGKLQDKFNWVVNLDEFNMEVILNLQESKFENPLIAGMLFIL